MKNCRARRIHITNDIFVKIVSSNTSVDVNSDQDDTTEDQNTETDDNLYEQYLNTTITKGTIVSCNGTSYIARQDFLFTENLIPSNDGLVALWLVYTGLEYSDWIQNEYVEIGWQRIYNDILYTASQDPNDNTYPPTEAVSVWTCE